MNVLDKLPRKVINDVDCYASYISDYMSHFNFEYKLFLFGSISKFNYTDDSDIDLLLLINRDFESIRDCKKFKYALLYDCPNLDRELDLKVYSMNHFYSTDNFFENSIKSDLVRVR